jgi:hypothetical protein
LTVLVDNIRIIGRSGTFDDDDDDDDDDDEDEDVGDRS